MFALTFFTKKASSYPFWDKSNFRIVWSMKNPWNVPSQKWFSIQKVACKKSMDNFMLVNFMLKNKRSFEVGDKIANTLYVTPSSFSTSYNAAYMISITSQNRVFKLTELFTLMGQILTFHYHANSWLCFPEIKAFYRKQPFPFNWFQLMKKFTYTHAEYPKMWMTNP